MAELSVEARSVYSLLQGELDGLLDKKLSGFADALTKSINAKFEAATSSFSAQLNELQDELSRGCGGRHGTLVLFLNKGEQEQKMQHVERCTKSCLRLRSTPPSSCVCDPMLADWS